MNLHLSRLGIVVAAVTVAATAGCGGDAGTPGTPGPVPGAPGTSSSAPSPGPSGRPSPPSSPPSARPATPGASTPVGTPAPGAAHWTVSPWTSGPTTVVHRPAVPPVPVVLRIRAAAHPREGFDRLVFDIRGALPGYTVRYVDEVRTDPSDRPVAVPGRRFLLVVLSPAQAHEDDGTATLSGARRLDLSMMRGYAVAGDFEGHVSVAIGLDDVVGYRVGELTGRIFIDVAA
ncbi:AMIN-like domain-containing (lipo)protein [Spirilliplanes yamanashiensis]|uniref:AMIN-like domain-containing protein n=1 Tax=Spirilliplanes yamanashiensis TaxID=42233 RepID=A0A8J3YEY7_9ACTN|nr:hypothetical protein [Spirilliplanes yamanashiensis]MDP9818281.1 hypothetical protein [Spirilliplanes yamanashiensis]GIJ06699.1 hypothetical protein Sya03_60510 [Spirilliplanes yamanashiensis]